MSGTFTTNRRVEFCHTDAAGIAHFSAFFTFMEQAEHELLRSVGLSVVMQDGSQTVSWPRVSATCDFVGAAKFEDVLQIDVDIERLGNKSVTYAFRFSHSGAEIANGRITTVCCHIESGVPPRSIPIPADISEKLRAFLQTE